MANAKPFCPECNKPATGNFCQSCGAKLGGRFCNKCGHKLSGGASFCNQCGAQAAGGTGDHRAAAAQVVGGQNLPWWIAGIALFGLIVVVGTQMVRTEGPSVPPGTTASPAAPAAGTGTPPDISQMTPIEAADRLFNRVMQAASDGDSTTAQSFMPMAMAAYERAQPLNADGLFHLALLQQTAMEFEGALASAQQILDANPNHLLGLSAAADVTVEMGRTDEAAGYFQRIVDVYDAEMADPEPEYLDHAVITNGLKTKAEAFLSGR